MLQRMVLAAGIACVLAACSPPAQQAENGASAPADAAAAGGMQPGQYRTTITMRELSIPGAPSTPINMAPTVTEDCVTSSDIAEFTQGDMVDGDSGDTCTQNSMSTAGGQIQGESTCTGPNGTRTVQISGTYSANRVDMDISSTSTDARAGVGTMRMSLASERIGECPAGEATD